jgi:hypothetical protein
MGSRKTLPRENKFSKNKINGLQSLVNENFPIKACPLFGEAEIISLASIGITHA